MFENFWVWLETRRVDRLEARAEKERCKACEVLEKELYAAHARESRLIDLLHPAKVEREETNEELQPVNRTKFVPWAVKRQQLERESRERAALKVKPIEDLEKELDIPSATEKSGN